jgi:hypothetical protein
MPFILRNPWLASLATFLMLPALQAATLLQCELTYAGSTQTLHTGPVANPYPVKSVDVGGRFWFKAVMVGTVAQVDYVKLYAYLDTHGRPVLVQQVTYLPPFARGTSLTGKQFIFAGPAERELQYQCALKEEAP